jgi:tight adherence protein B
MKRILLVLIVVLAAVGAGAATAGAATQPTLSQATSAAFPERAFVLTLPDRRVLRTGDVDVRENGKAVERLSVVPADQAGGKSFGVVLAIDSSESMHDGAIDDAMAAARTFAGRRSPHQQLGLLFFDHDRSIALPLTDDTARIDRVLAETPELHKGTRIYDAASEAVAMLSEAGVRAGSVVLLSDGADVGSETPPAALTAAARRAHVRVFTVGLRSASFSPSALSAIADATGGVYSEAGSKGSLKDIYAALGAQLAAEYLVSYRSLAPLESDVRVEARINGFEQAALAAYRSPEFPAGTAKRAHEERWSSPLIVAIVAVIFALLLAAAVMLVLRGPRVGVRDRIGQYVNEAPLPLGLDLDEVRDERSLLGRVESAVRRGTWWPKVAEEIELAGVRMAPARFAGITIAGTVVAVWFLGVVANRPFSAVLVAFTPFVVHGLLRARVERRRRLFADQLPDNLQVVASAMRAGHTFASGLAVASEDADEPARAELRRLVADERLGVPLEEAMEAVARRMDSREMEQVGIVVQLQRESGGNSAEVLDRVVDALRYRGELRRMVRSLTAQGRLGGAIVTALPLFMVLALSILSPGYLEPMLEHVAGVIALIAGGCMLVVGWLIVRKLVDIKV